MQVYIGIGKANFKLIYASFACMRVKPPFLRDSALSSGRQIRDGQTGEWHAGAIAEHGVLYRRLIEHEPGTILMLQVGWKRNGAPTRDGAIFLRLREGASRWSIEGRLPMDADNRHGEFFNLFTGNADMLAPADLAAYGIEANKNYRERFMAAEEIEECFRVSCVVAESIPRPNLTLVGEGETRRLVEVAAPLRRRMNLRRG